MSDNGFVRLDRLKTALSRVKTKVDSDIADAISESTISLTSVINSGDASTLSEAKGYADGLKIIIDGNISSGDSSTLTNANSYTDTKISSVNLTINDLSESIPGQIALALEDYTEYSDFSDHTSDTSNPHNVTYSQTGAAAASHTHVEADITDLGSYASSSHTHTESDITDLGNYASSSHSHNLSDINNITASSTEINYLSGATGNIQQQLNSLVTSGTTITLADLGGASATDLTNHTGNTNNPHSVTYTQVGAAASSHTHTESDITDLGSYASSSHTHNKSDITDISDLALASNLSNHTSDTSNPHSVTYSQTGAAPATHTHELTDVTDITATATEVNYLTNSSRNIQMQLNDARMYGFFPAWEYNHAYQCEDVVRVPGCKPLQYLECIVAGTSGYISKITITDDNQVEDDIEFYIIPYNDYGHYFAYGYTENLTTSSVQLSDLDNFHAGDTIIDGTCVWIVQDLRDGRLIGEITHIPHWLNVIPYNTYQYGLDLLGIYENKDPTRASHDYLFYEGTTNAEMDIKIFKLKTIRLLKYLMSSSFLLTEYNITTSNNKHARLFGLWNGTSLKLNNNSYHNPTLKSNGLPLITGGHLICGIVIMDWALHPFDYLSNDRVGIIDENVFNYINLNKYHSEYNISNNKNDYIDAALNLKDKMKTIGLDWEEKKTLYCVMNKISNKYLSLGYFGRMKDPGLPEITGAWPYTRASIDSTTNPSQDGAGYFKEAKTNKMSITNANNKGWGELAFKASRANSIYGNSTTVVPDTLQVSMIMKF